MKLKYVQSCLKNEKSLNYFYWKYLLWIILGWKFHVWIQQVQISETAKFRAKKTFTPGTKTALFECFRVEFEKTIVIFEISTIEFCTIQSSTWNKKTLSLRPKLAYWAAILKQYCHIWNQHPRICGIAKFNPKQKNFKLGTKIVLFWYF